ncbi:hypothetical protein Q0Z83_048000 [Actinoplanes sichuanensis]|uniref:TIM-barrel domain-containing protein n=1 Tax=Actinoplanes sichuanensis TaxID=512349 RepID=A0ABW4AP07_9ACTN|nr:TIM-barrel domain-containing protein [Actinoplanes sichuanensis]BEL06609.1 hypothetical protein Q0Z83_048000 [Actinoplanes sichuanensis]
MTLRIPLLPGELWWGGAVLDGTAMPFGRTAFARDLAVSADAYLSQIRPAGRAPARRMFRAPQYNTWIDMPYTPTQESVLGYARRILDLGMPPGVLMIDDSWSPAYGTWVFDRARFPDPPGMIATLREAGFAVMLRWGSGIRTTRCGPAGGSAASRSPSGSGTNPRPGATTGCGR